MQRRSHRQPRVLRGIRDWLSFVLAASHASAPPDLRNPIARTLWRRLTPEEKAYVDKIERLRRVLEGNHTPIPVVDYGAGSFSAPHPGTRMEAGGPEQRVISDICKLASKPAVWALFLFNLVRERQPLVCLEMGTSLGLSGSYIASALKLNGSGKLVTLEGSQTLAEIAMENFRTLDLDNVTMNIGLFAETLAPAAHAIGPIDFAFVDGHHEEEATMRYFEILRSNLSDKAIMVFDDIAWSSGMRSAWFRISSVSHGFSLGPFGVVRSAEAGSG